MEEYALRLFERRKLRKILEPNRDNEGPLLFI
jgi:hypothetical protein